MPIAAPRVCNKCHSIVNGKCHICTKQSNIDYSRFSRDVSHYNKFYNNSKWRLLRDLALKRDAGLCVMCRENGIFTKADVVDHIVPTKVDESLAYDLSNLRCLCHYHHNNVTQEQKKQYGL